MAWRCTKWWSDLFPLLFFVLVSSFSQAETPPIAGHADAIPSRSQNISNLPTLALVRKTLAYYCSSPFQATCDRQWSPTLDRPVDNQPLNLDFFQEVKAAVRRAIDTDPSSTPEQKQKLRDRILPVRFQVGNDPSFCDPGRPSAMAKPQLRLVYVCQGMVDKAVLIGRASGKGPRSYLFHVISHELGHFLSQTTFGVQPVMQALSQFTRLYDEAIADYYADRAMAFWKNWPDALTLMNAARDSLQLLCGMSQRNDHPLHSQRAQMLRWLDVGQRICSAELNPPTRAVTSTSQGYQTSPPSNGAEPRRQTSLPITLPVTGPPVAAVTAAADRPAPRPVPVAMGNVSVTGVTGYCVATPVAKKRTTGNFCDITYLSSAHCFYFPQNRSFARRAVRLGKRTYPINRTKLEMSDEFRQNPFAQVPGERDVALLHVVDNCQAVADSQLAKLAQPASSSVAPVRPGETLLAGNRDGSLIRGAVTPGTVGQSRSYGMRVTAGVAKEGISGSPIWNLRNEVVGTVSTGTGPNGIGRLVGFSSRALAWARAKLDIEIRQGAITGDAAASAVAQQGNPIRTVANANPQYQSLVR